MIKGDAIICTSNSAYNITIGKKYIIEEVGSLVLKSTYNLFQISISGKR